MSTRACKLTAHSLSNGVIVCTLAPFDEQGAVLLDGVTDQARRLARIDGVIGIAVNTVMGERHVLSPDERTSIIRHTRNGLDDDQVLLSCVGELSDTMIDEVETSRVAGADAIIACPANEQSDRVGQNFEERLNSFVDVAARLCLPVIVALGTEEAQWATDSGQITELARRSRRVLGFSMGADDNVLRYDRNYYALKSLDRPLACLPSSEGALFHNLNTGADGVLSCLACVAPHEVAALYQATRDGRFHDAQAVHNRLAPLYLQLEGHDAHAREMIYREVAHYRGLLASPDGRETTEALCPKIKSQLHHTVEQIGLKSISWV